MQSTTFQNVLVVATTIIREVHLHELTKIVKPFKLATLLKFEQKREHFTRHCMHLNAKGKASAAKLIVNCVNSIQKMKKPISLGWKVKPNGCISEVNEVKLDCFPLITSPSSDAYNNDFVSNLNNRYVVQFALKIIEAQKAL
jgi:hypothetical protein